MGRGLASPPGWAYPARLRAGWRGGFTLLELLFVMVLLGILMGLGTLGIQRLDPGARGLQVSVATFLESTRDRARSSGQAVDLVVEAGDPDAGVPPRMVRYVFRRVREASFEPELRVLQGAELVAPATDGAPGRFGAGLDCGEGGGVLLEGSGGTLRPRHGVAVEMDVFLPDLAAGRLLVWDGLLDLRVDRDGSLAGRLDVRVAQEDVRLQVRSAAAVVLPGRWQRLRISAAAGRFRVEADGRTVAEETFEGFLPEPGGTPFFGDPDGRFRGRLDELGIWVRTPEAGPEFREDVVAELDPQRVRFDRRGFLDPELHSGAVEVGIMEFGVEVAHFRVGRFSEEEAAQ
ncbi:MAG TPA: prepilin-type N-terminal cleavage/methylation domain-containing protein [Planctomycetota bacterium]